MINRGNDVPDKKIALFSTKNNVDFEQVSGILQKPKIQREWFKPSFYHCLPLAIGNQYGFNVVPNFSFNVMWDGSNHPNGINITYIGDPNIEKNCETLTHFGHGIITIGIPLILRTPPGINLMTINPPNYTIDNATVLTGVVEADNLRFSFTINLKIQQPNVITHFPAGKPICNILPIPRYFGDKFEVVDANTIFSKELVEEELSVFEKNKEVRIKNQSLADQNQTKWKDFLDKLYMKGMDVFGNKFPDHQR